MGDPLALILIVIVGIVVFYGMFSGNKNKHKSRKTAANELNIKLNSTDSLDGLNTIIETREPNHYVTSADKVEQISKTPAPEPVVRPIKRRYISMETYLSDHGISFIDNRPKGGALWVADTYQIFNDMKLELLKKGIVFHLAENGGKASNHRKAWYTKSIDHIAYQHSEINWLLPESEYDKHGIKKSFNQNVGYIDKGDNKYSIGNNARAPEKPKIIDPEEAAWRSFIADEEEKMNDYETAHTCRNCMLHRAQECVGEKQICDLFRYSPRPPKPVH